MERKWTQVRRTCAEDPSSVNHTYRKEKSTKIIELDLDPKQKLTNITNRRFRRDVFGTGDLDKPIAKSRDGDDIDEGLDMSGEAAASTSSDASVDEDDIDEDEEDVLPRDASGHVKSSRGRNERVISPGEVQRHLRRLFKEEAKICSILFGRHGGTASSFTPSSSDLADMFFMDVIPVTPTRFRPAARMGDEVMENAQNSLLSALIQTSRRIQDLNQRLIEQAKVENGEAIMEKVIQAEGNNAFALLLESLIKLQNDVNSFMDSTKNPTVMRQGKLPPAGIKQILEKKEGLFRKHMMVSNLEGPRSAVLILLAFRENVSTTLHVR